MPAHHSPRNLSDEHAHGIAQSGGLIGAAFFPETVGGKTIAAIARSIRYGADLVGVAHIAIGTDFDGAIQTPIDAAGMPYLAAALAQRRFVENEIIAIMGGNALRLLAQLLPQEPDYWSLAKIDFQSRRRGGSRTAPTRENFKKRQSPAD